MNSNKGNQELLSPEKMKTLEEYYDVKLVVPNSLIILHNYTLWRPVISETEELVARKNKVPVFTLSSTLVFVPLLWTSIYKF